MDWFAIILFIVLIIGTGFVTGNKKVDKKYSTTIRALFFIYSVLYVLTYDIFHI